MITSYQTAGSPLARKAWWPSIDTSHTVQQWNKKRHARSLQGHCDICIRTEVRQRAVTFPDCFKSGCSNISTSYAMQLPLTLRMQLVCWPLPASGKPAHFGMSMCLNALPPALLKYGICRSRPSGRTQAGWDIGCASEGSLYLIKFETHCKRV